MKNSKYILAGLSLFCIVLIAVTSINNSILAPLRTGVGYVLVPFQSGVNAVGTSLYNGIRDLSTLREAQAENEDLKNRVAELTEENNRLQAEQYELERLRELYELDQDYMQYEKVAARVIAKDSGNWFQIFRINKGADDGIRENMNVIAGGGLVGIVTDVGANYATVRSIIDDSSSVSAMTASTSDTCIVSGDLRLISDGKLAFSQLNTTDTVAEGEKIVTSNISDKYLRGILIGYVSEITEDSNHLTKKGYIIPVVDFQHIQEVLVIKELKQQGGE